MGRTVRRHQLQTARFPSVAMLQCCAINYLDVGARAVGNMSELQCFARRCFEVPCPSRAIGACAQRKAHAQLDALAEAAATQVGFDPHKGFTGFVAGLRAPGQMPVLSFKYEYEGRAAVMHATALSFPGASFHVPADAHPPRLDIALPLALGSRLASAAVEPAQGQANHSYFYSCINCINRLGSGLGLGLALSLALTLTLALTPTLTLTSTAARPPAASTVGASTTRRNSSGRARAARPASTTTAHRWPQSAACTPTPRGTSSSDGGAARSSNM